MIIIPKYYNEHSSVNTVAFIRENEWAVISAKLCIKDSNMVLQFGSFADVPRYEAIAEQHNANLLMGVSDEDYNAGVRAYHATIEAGETAKAGSKEETS